MNTKQSIRYQEVTESCHAEPVRQIVTYRCISCEARIRCHPWPINERHFCSACGAALTILSVQEKRILSLYARGEKIAKISKDLFISRKTVESHLTNICRKIQVHSRADIVKYAIVVGITSPEPRFRVE